MLQQVMLGLAVSSAYIFGPLLGRWTKEEGEKIRKSNLIKSLNKYSIIVASVFGVILGLAWAWEHEFFVSLSLFGLILAVSSLDHNRKKAVKNVIVFLALFFATSLMASFLN